MQDRHRQRMEKTKKELVALTEANDYNKIFSDYFDQFIVSQCNVVKPFVIDRKNFLFANTPKGAAGSAVMFSLIQTAIENNLDPYKYLTWLLKRAKDADLSDEQTIRTLLPWNAPLECRAGRKESKA